MSTKHRLELVGYVATAVGMALACSGYAMLGELSALVDGPALLVAVLIGGLLCILISASIGELASAYPSAPGIRTYLRAAFGDQLSLAVSFALLAMVVLFAGVESHAFFVAISAAIPGAPPLLSITLVLGVVIAMNVIGFEWPERMQLLLTVVLVVALVSISVAALLIPPRAVAAAVETGGQSFGAQVALATGGTVFLFTGFEWVAPLGRNADAYRSRIPWSMPIALAVLLVLFSLLAWARVRHLPANPHDGVEAPHVALGVHVLGRTGAYLMATVSALSVVTTFNAGLMGTTRLVYALARERCLPRWCATISIESGAPIGAVLTVGGACWVAAVLQELLRVHLAVSLVCAAVYCGVYAAYVLGSVRLRKAAAGKARVFNSVVPSGVQLVLVVLLVGLGCSVLFAERSVVGLTLAMFAGLTFVCAAAASLVASRRVLGGTRVPVTVASRSEGDVR